jgi:cyanophycinase
MQIVSKRANSNEAILSGTSAGSMIMCSPIYGDGIPYGHLYFSVSAGLAPKNVSDGAVNGTGTEDMRNGSKGIQHSDNGGIMPGFGFLPFLVDTHFDARGRLGRIIPAIVSMKKDYGVGVDESSAFFYDNGKAKVYGKNGAFIVDITKATLNIQTYFGINNVIVHYLTSGDEFDFSTK